MRDLVAELSDGSRVTYLDGGVRDGSPVILLHGTPASRVMATGRLDDAARGLGLRLVAPDRPGLGGSSFVPYRVVDYPILLARFADAVGIDDFTVVGTSGGGRYACATGCLLGDRVQRVILVGSTVSPDLAGAKSTWNEGDRTAYLVARRAPWVFRALVATMARKLRRDPESWRGLLPELCPADQGTLGRGDARTLMPRMLGETLRQGSRGLAHDYRLEASPWGIDPAGIKAPVDIWHGQDDTMVKPAAAGLLAKAIPGATLHLVPGQGHFSLIIDEAARYLSTRQGGQL
jgi:pimeloyl-ACP methyl ester carboxylesterase